MQAALASIRRSRRQLQRFVSFTPPSDSFTYPCTFSSRPASSYWAQALLTQSFTVTTHNPLSNSVSMLSQLTVHCKLPSPLKRRQKTYRSAPPDIERTLPGDKTALLSPCASALNQTYSRARVLSGLLPRSPYPELFVQAEVQL